MTPALIKSERQSAAVPFSSGDTIVLDDRSESTLTEEPVDEGYHTNHEAKKADRTRRSVVGHPSIIPDEGDPQNGLQVLGRGVKELVQAVQDLRHLGVEDLSLPLPRIVVVGDQSTGKSSLIEGITEIKVPRQAGTCTRCPMEINITESSSPEVPWTCRISLHQKYYYEGKLSTSRFGKGATRARPLGPWTAQDSVDLEFATVHSKQDVTRVLHLAQLATLNPGRSHLQYLPTNYQTKDKDFQQVKFSPNVVRLDITGPDLPNLSFFDLPGVINVSEVADEEYLVDLVGNLVKEYIKAPQCINLLALPMTDDPMNSSASRLIRNVKAEHRTVGCLTKPDRIQQGEALDQWIEILNGQRFRLGFGYHMIKNNPDVNIDHKTARREEEAFFATQEPWATALGTYADRFGTRQLQSALSQRLTAQIRTSLPRIIEQVHEKADSIHTQLSQLPETLDSNLAVSVMAELIKFERLLETHINGGLMKEWHLATLKLRKDLADTRPVLVFPGPQTPQHSQSSRTVTSTRGTPTPMSKNAALISIDSDDSDAETPTTKSPVLQLSGQKRQLHTNHATPNKSQRTAASPSCAKANIAYSKRFSLSEVQNIMQDAYTGLPGQVDPKALETMIVLSMNHWDVPLDRYLEETRRLCQDMVFEQIQEVYAKYSETQYYEIIREICEQFFEKVFSEQRQLAKRILGWEQSSPKTSNEEAFEIARERSQTMLQMKRRETRAGLYLDELEMKAGKLSSGQARIDKLARITDAQLGVDPHQHEIKAMSTVKGYYECAYYRFVDVVSASHCELFAKCRYDIVKEMRDRFGLTEPGVEDRLAVLLAANPAQAQRRAQLKKEMDTITKAQERLEGLNGND